MRVMLIGFVPRFCHSILRVCNPPSSFIAPKSIVRPFAKCMSSHCRVAGFATLSRFSREMMRICAREEVATIVATKAEIMPLTILIMPILCLEPAAIVCRCANCDVERMFDNERSVVQNLDFCTCRAYFQTLECNLVALDNLA